MFEWNSVNWSWKKFADTFWVFYLFGTVGICCAQFLWNGAVLWLGWVYVSESSKLLPDSARGPMLMLFLPRRFASANVSRESSNFLVPNFHTHVYEANLFSFIQSIMLRVTHIQRLCCMKRSPGMPLCQWLFWLCCRKIPSHVFSLQEPVRCSGTGTCSFPDSTCKL